jgi:hypothetical protein
VNPLPLDHLPFNAAELAGLAQAFGTLGFTVSPRGAYTSPSQPAARWPNHSVFLRAGWFDLLQEPSLPTDALLAPRACLFRAGDLAAAAQALSPLRTTTPYGLVRRWDQDLGLEPETFELFSLRERVAPLPVAVIAHAYPCCDIRPDWLDHPNSAQAVAGLIFADAAPGPAATKAGQALDLSGFQYWGRPAFEAEFGPGVEVAVRVRVGSLGQVAAVLNAGGVGFRQGEAGICVPPHGRFGCGFAFYS